MNIWIGNRQRKRKVDLRRLRSRVARILASLGRTDRDLNIVLVGDAAMRRLNRQFRDLDAPTDVLAFPGGGAPNINLLGEIVISIDTAARQAAAAKLPVRRELDRLLIHGTLHLLGFDHHLPAESRRMRREERRQMRIS